MSTRADRLYRADQAIIFAEQRVTRQLAIVSALGPSGLNLRAAKKLLASLEAALLALREGRLRIAEEPA